MSRRARCRSRHKAAVLILIFTPVDILRHLSRYTPVAVLEPECGDGAQRWVDLNIASGEDIWGLFLSPGLNGVKLLLFVCYLLHCCNVTLVQADISPSPSYIFFALKAQTLLRSIQDKSVFF